MIFKWHCRLLKTNLLLLQPQLMAQKVATRVADMAKRSFIPLLGVIENMSYFETNNGEKFNLFGQGGGDALAEQFSSVLGKIPISEDTNDIADDGTLNTSRQHSN